MADDNVRHNDDVQHGLDDNPENDPAKGAALGGLGGAAVGAAAGSMIGPVGTVIGAVVGGLAGAGASGAAVAAVDSMDNDNTVTGVGGDEAGGGRTRDNDTVYAGTTDTTYTGTTDTAYAEPTTTAGWEDVQPRYQTAWEQRSGATGGDWTEHEQGHRYAWEVSNDPRYRGRSWDDAETDLRSDWESRYPDRSWDQASSSVRHGWENRDEIIRLHEEELRVQKQMTQAGEVAVRKEVITEQRTIDVPVTREEVVVERRPVSGSEARGAGITGGDIGDGEEIRVPIMEEQVTVQKTPVVTEEVTISKREVQDTQQVSDTVRREELRVDQQGDVNVRDSSGGV